MSVRDDKGRGFWDEVKEGIGRGLENVGKKIQSPEKRDKKPSLRSRLGNWMKSVKGSGFADLGNAVADGKKRQAEEAAKKAAEEARAKSEAEAKEKQAREEFTKNANAILSENRAQFESIKNAKTFATLKKESGVDNQRAIQHFQKLVDEFSKSTDKDIQRAKLILGELNRQKAELRSEREKMRPELKAGRDNVVNFKKDYRPLVNASKKVGEKLKSLSGNLIDPKTGKVRSDVVQKIAKFADKQVVYDNRIEELDAEAKQQLAAVVEDGKTIIAAIKEKTVQIKEIDGKINNLEKVVAELTKRLDEVKSLTA